MAGMIMGIRPIHGPDPHDHGLAEHVSIVAGGSLAGLDASRRAEWRQDTRWPGSAGREVHDFGGGSLGGRPVAKNRTQVHPAGVTRGRGGGAQRAGGEVHLGVGGGGVRVVEHEMVDQAARGPARESAGDRGGGERGIREGRLVPRWAPASGPWAHRPSAPRAAATSASSGAVTVTHTRIPAARSAAMMSSPGQPNVKLTTAGGPASRAASLASQSSSSQPAAPNRTPSAAASGSSSAR